MTHHDRMSGLIIHNVSRRNMLKGIASVGGLVLAACGLPTDGPRGEAIERTAS